MFNTRIERTVDPQNNTLFIEAELYRDSNTGDSVSRLEFRDFVLTIQNGGDFYIQTGLDYVSSDSPLVYDAYVIKYNNSFSQCDLLGILYNSSTPSYSTIYSLLANGSGSSGLIVNTPRINSFGAAHYSGTASQFAQQILGRMDIDALHNTSLTYDSGIYAYANLNTNQTMSGINTFLGGYFVTKLFTRLGSEQFLGSIKFQGYMENTGDDNLFIGYSRLDDGIPTITSPLYTTLQPSGIRYVEFDIPADNFFFPNTNATNRLGVAIGYSGYSGVNKHPQVRLYSYTYELKGYCTPPTGLFRNLNLTTKGKDYASSNLDFYLLSKGYVSGNVNLYTISSIAFSGDVNLLTSGKSQDSKTLTFVMTKLDPGEKELDFFLPGQVASANINMSVEGKSTPSFSNIDFVSYGDEAGTRTKDVPFYMTSEIHAAEILMMTPGRSGPQTENINLYLYNNSYVTKDVDFYLSNNYIALSRDINMSIQGFGINEGAAYSRGDVLLSIGQGNYVERDLSFITSGPTQSDRDFNMAMFGAYSSSHDVDFAIPVVLSKINNNVNLYTHGF